MGHSPGVGVNLQWTQAVEAVEPEVSCTSDILQPQELVYIPWALSSLWASTVLSMPHISFI